MTRDEPAKLARIFLSTDNATPALMMPAMGRSHVTRYGSSGEAPETAGRDAADALSAALPEPGTTGSAGGHGRRLRRDERRSRGKE